MLKTKNRYNFLRLLKVFFYYFFYSKKQNTVLKNSYKIWPNFLKLATTEDAFMGNHLMSLWDAAWLRPFSGSSLAGDFDLSQGVMPSASHQDSATFSFFGQLMIFFFFFWKNRLKCYIPFPTGFWMFMSCEFVDAWIMRTRVICFFTLLFTSAEVFKLNKIHKRKILLIIFSCSSIIKPAKQLYGLELLNHFIYRVTLPESPHACTPNLKIHSFDSDLLRLWSSFPFLSCWWPSSCGLLVCLLCVLRIYHGNDYGYWIQEGESQASSKARRG